MGRCWLLYGIHDLLLIVSLVRGRGGVVLCLGVDAGKQVLVALRLLIFVVIQIVGIGVLALEHDQVEALVLAFLERSIFVAHVAFLRPGHHILHRCCVAPSNYVPLVPVGATVFVP